MTTICLVRHGETDWNALGKLQGRTDIPLNAVGIQQAQECAAFLAEKSWDVIVTSPLLRAKGTAEVINQSLNLPFIEMDAFMERSFGHAEGMTVKERRTLFPTNAFPNQEEREIFRARIMQGIEQVREDFSGKRVLLVAHGAVINAILSLLSDGEIGSGKTRLHNACLSTIFDADGNWEIGEYNQVGHLSNPGTSLIL